MSYLVTIEQQQAKDEKIRKEHTEMKKKIKTLEAQNKKYKAALELKDSCFYEIRCQTSTARSECEEALKEE